MIIRSMLAMRILDGPCETSATLGETQSRCMGQTVGVTGVEWQVRSTYSAMSFSRNWRITSQFGAMAERQR
jgi:hypothetical protein